MDRCKDYACFIAWFAGLGYLLLWAVSLHASVSGAALRLPPALHALGALSAMYVAMRFSMLAIRRWRSAAVAAGTMPPDSVAARLGPQPWKTPAGAAAVKPRAQFGLRGTRH